MTADADNHLANTTLKQEIRATQRPQATSRNEKCGYQFEDITRSVYFHGGAYRDMEIYSLLRSETPTTLDALIDSLP